MKIFQILKNRDNVLGQNARNSVFIKNAGDHKGRRIADDKLLTKKLLIEAKIPTPELLGVIDDFRELYKFDWNSLPKSFVLKPVKGSQGGGIEIFYNKDKDGNWIRTDGSKVSLIEVKTMCRDILDGQYSLDKNPDRVFFEKRVRTHKDLRNYSYKGTPDVRIVVYNNIPIQAYVRFPTKESNGKANMILGAVGTGIDLASGITTTSVKGKDRGGKGQVIEFVPGTKLPYQGLKIPYWDEILKYAIQAQKAIGLNFVAIDFLIDIELGPVIVEMNARPGLSIQLVNNAGMAWQLNRVKGIQVKNIQQGIRIGKEIFGGEVEETIERISGKQVISNVMPVEITFEKQKVKTMALIDTSIRTTCIDSKTAVELGILDEKSEEGEYFIEKIKIILANQLVESTCKILPKNDSGYKIHIGRKDLVDFIIDVKKVEREEESELREEINSVRPKTTFKRLDLELEDITSKLSVAKAVRVTNLEEEKKHFIDAKYQYNPVFEYEPLRFDADEVLLKLNNLNPPNTPQGELYKEKIKELRRIIFLIESIGQGPTTFTQRSISIYGKPSKRILKYANIIIASDRTVLRSDRLRPTEVKKLVEETFAKLKIKQKISFSTRGPQKASMSNSSGKLTINPDYGWTENNLYAMIGHEVMVHLTRYNAGSLNKYRIFQFGTSGYLQTEEGLATLVKYTRKNNKLMWSGAMRTVAMDLALNNDFQTVFEYINNKVKNFQYAWNMTVSIKKGLSDTSQPGCFTKNQYYEWAIRLGELILKNPESLQYLFNGKGDVDNLMKFTERSDFYINVVGIEDIEIFLQTNKKT